MGLLDKLIPSREPAYPSLPADNYATQRIAAVREQLQQLIEDTGERLEVVPAQRAAYVFVGKPPKKFGLAWVHDGRISNFKTLVEEHGVNPIRLERILDHLREAYQRSADQDRYTLPIGKQSLVVTPSATLESEVHRIIDEVLSS